MSESGKKYKRVINNDEKVIENKENSEYINENLEDILLDFSEKLNNIAGIVEKITMKQKEMEERVEKLQKHLDSIEGDIYMDNEFDLEVICPYCDYNFMLDSEELSDEIKCPECDNLIEIDWDGECLSDDCEDGCGDSCGGCCSHGCRHEHEEGHKKEKKNKKQNEEQDDNEDDM